MANPVCVRYSVTLRVVSQSSHVVRVSVAMMFYPLARAMS